VPDVRYVILSDLHFGAENSVLTDVLAGQDRADPAEPGPGMQAFVACLRDLMAQNEGAHKPTLVLGGDMLELALALDNVAAMVFERFVELTMVGTNRLFAQTIYFVPGNHDHHLWEGAREKHYAQYVASVPRGQPLKGPRHTTPMLGAHDENPTDAQLLTALVRRSGAHDLQVQTVYPNLAFLSHDGRKGVVFHHGHFVESMYRLMSVLNEMIFERPTPPEIAVWEAENFAWIDFFWSTLGRSGDVGFDVALIYESLQSQRATDELVGQLAAGIAGRIHHGWVRRHLAHRALKTVLDVAAARVQTRERRHTAAPLSPDAQRGLRTYVEGPLRNQMVAECNGDPPSDVTFVFGHTHKPFVDVMDAAGYPAPVPIMNTGGWVVDGLEPEPLHGASAVLLDEDLNPVMLRFYAQRAEPSEYRPVVETAPGRPDSEFARRLRAIVTPARDPWRAFSATMATVVRQRNEDLAEIISRPPQVNQPGAGAAPTA
jgi:Calcineurin-like phosphoesterase